MIPLNKFARQIAAAYVAGERENVNLGDFVWRMMLFYSLKTRGDFEVLYGLVQDAVLDATRTHEGEHGGEWLHEAGLAREGSCWRVGLKMEDGCRDYMLDTQEID